MYMLLMTKLGYPFGVVCVERIVDGFGSNNLTKVIMAIMFKG